jgi:hypothetical protein
VGYKNRLARDFINAKDDSNMSLAIIKQLASRKVESRAEDSIQNMRFKSLFWFKNNNNAHSLP